MILSKTRSRAPVCFPNGGGRSAFLLCGHPVSVIQGLVCPQETTIGGTPTTETLHLPETPDKAALGRIERVIAYKNVQFIIDHQHDTPEQLSAYLKACMDELGHVPAKVEVIGGDYLEYRFGTWRKALGSFYSGSIASSKNPPPFAARKIVRDLYALELRRKERSAGEVQR